MRSAWLLLLLALPVLAQEPAREVDESTPDYDRALDLLAKKRFAAAQAALRKLLEDYPETVHYRDAEARSDDNCYLGTDTLHLSGPPARRIDVAVMGDGFTIDAKDQALEEKWAKLCLDVLWNEQSFLEYRDYFNLYFVRLASLEEGVDPALSDAERAKIEERNRRRVRKRKTEFSTALDAKAAGPQGQVMMDRGLVYRWLEVAEGDVPGAADDGLVIAFARFGQLGMGGGGVANVGRPDKSITVHEFGHAFTGLLDEYVGNPDPPQWKIRAANATSDRSDIPWQHFLDARVKGVDVIEGGATHSRGVWRPAPSCAMNAAGATQFCPVCREANVLAVYSFVSPIDESRRSAEFLEVVPMKPRTHDLDVTWYVRRVPEEEAAAKEKPGRVDPEDDWWRRRLDAGNGFGGGEFEAGERARADRSAYAGPPAGERSNEGKVVRGARGQPDVHRFPLAALAAGRYVVTAVARDPTPWVLKDDLHLLEERATFEVVIP